jgi:hypothetical protein
MSQECSALGLHEERRRDRMGSPAGSKGAKQSGDPMGRGPEALRIKLLGGFSVSVRYRIIQQNEWRLRMAAALVKMLALSPNHRLHREQVIDALWPELGKRAASNNLRQALHAARRALASDSAVGSHYLATQDEQLALCPSGRLWVDVDRFVEAAATARRTRDPAAYRAAIELYAGELLPADIYEEWTEVRHQELHGTFLTLLVELAGLYEERGEHGPATESLQRVLGRANARGGPRRSDAPVRPIWEAAGGPAAVRAAGGCALCGARCGARGDHPALAQGDRDRSVPTTTPASIP